MGKSEKSLKDQIEEVVKDLMEHEDAKLREKGARLALTFKRQEDTGSGEVLSTFMQTVFSFLFSFQEWSGEDNFEKVMDRMQGICPTCRKLRGGTTDFEVIYDDIEVLED